MYKKNILYIYSVITLFFCCKTILMLINFRDMQNKVFENKNWVYGVNKVPIMFLLPVYETTGFIFV